ncbi:hypothetical protein SERLADRAFT_471745 [Serpula lacrymans var. lacrymans S7.9]|uniref:Uncharacterized protein n=1 Tax=Serpula lacrymans var. lacrymans (strain S7.9) TaxID=578457 RepID=F8P1N4_SERL9|nr:uncharacterized protein SERLADRAFT_471745 [Serpula lacrymans var. lacrymans S7.9]EGO23063.1 hypothetical protein SERLADRAFT_471745 [Serpula lacrymans var. lacrymans S7.9]
MPMNRSNDNVYQAPSHSTSPYMEVGPALQQALRLARCQASNLKQRKLEELPAENNVMDKDITREEQRLLSANAQVVKALEHLFSWRSYVACITGIRIEHRGPVSFRLSNPGAFSASCIASGCCPTCMGWEVSQSYRLPRTASTQILWNIEQNRRLS